jgi:hypothetical protein
LITINDTRLLQVRAEATVPEVASLQLRIGFTVDGNNAPEVENFNFKIK